MVNFNICPVCGYQMEVPPSDYNICSSCGTEFGHDIRASIPDLRAAWIRTGPAWWSRFNERPQHWDPRLQLDRLILNAPVLPFSMVIGQGGLAEFDPRAFRAKKRPRAKRILREEPVSPYRELLPAVA